MPHRFLPRCAAFAALVLLAPPLAAGPLVPCPDGPDPLRFEPGRPVPGADCGPANSGDCLGPEPACPGPVAIDAAVDPVGGGEYVALAWYSPAGEVWAAVSGDGGRSFDGATRGMPATMVAAGPARGRPAVAIRVEDGAVWLGLAYESAGETRVRLSDSLDGSFGAESVFAGAPFDLAPALVVSPAPLPPVFALASADEATREARFAHVAAERDPPAWAEQALPLGPDARVALAADAAGPGGGFGLTLVGAEARGELRLFRSDDGGPSWSAPRLVGPSPFGSSAVALDAAPDSALSDSAWSLFAHAWEDGGPRSLRADASRHAGGVIDHSCDEEAGTGSTEIEPAAEAVARPAVAAAPDGLAYLLWADAGELRLVRTLLGPSRPTLGGGCGPVRLTGLDPPRGGGGAAAPVAATLGPDLVVAWVDDRSGSPAVWIKRSDSAPPRRPELVATPSVCGEVPAVGLAWAPPEAEVVSQVMEVGSAPGGTDFSRDAGLQPALLVEGLQPGATYYFRLRVRDAAGHEAVSEEVSADLPSCSEALLSASVVAVDDSCPFGGAGGDGVLDPGETALLTVRVRNDGTLTAPGVRLRLLSRTGELLVRTGNLILLDIDPGSFAEADVRVDLSATLPCGGRVEALARSTSDGAFWGDLLDLGPPPGCTPCSSGACAVLADASASAPTETCAGDATTLDASMSGSVDCAGILLYEWWDGTDLVGTGLTESPSPGSSRSYRLVARCSTELSCTSEDTVDVLVHPLPGIGFGEDPPAPHCEGETIRLSASTGDPGASFAWDGGESLPTIDVDTGGLYRVTVTDTNGCRRSATWRVDFGPSPLADAGPDPEATACAPVRLGSPPFPLLDYRWDPPADLDDARAAQPFAAPAGPTLYRLTVTDPLSGCSATDEVMVDVRPPPPRVDGLLLARTDSRLDASWSSPLGRPVRLYAEAALERARSASDSSPSALRLCEGDAACSAGLPDGAIVYLQAVAVCEDGLSEGPN